MFSPSHSPYQRQRAAEPPGVTPPRRWRAPADDEIGWWPITFSDLVLLLLCFVVLWHVSEKRRPHPLPPTQGATVPHPRETSPPSEETAQPVGILPSETALSTSHEQRGTPPDLTTSPSLTEHSASPPSPANTEWRELQTEITRYVHEHGLDRAIGVVSTEQGLVISLSDTITFPSGRATLSSAVTPFLTRVAALAVTRAELDIEIAGHTDDRPIATLEFPSNWELSAARASRVARTLLEQGGIDPIRVSTRGYAHYRPVYANDTDEHRAANRRVEIRFFRRVETSY